MFVIAAALSVILAVVFILAGVMKLTANPTYVENLDRLGVGTGLRRIIGALEVAGGAGLLLGLAFGWLGVAAAAGLAVTMVGAIGYHAKIGDYADPKLRGAALSPAVLLVVLAVTAVLRLLTV